MSTPVKILLAVSFFGCVALMSFGFGRWGQALVHGNSQGCFLSLYQNLSTDTRAIITGSSRIRRSDLSGAVAEATNSEAHLVGDLSHPGVMLHFDYALADRFSQRQEIDLLVYEIWPEGVPLRTQLAGHRNAEVNNYGARESEYINGTPFPILFRHFMAEGGSLSLRGWELMNALTARGAYVASLVTVPRRVAQLRYTNAFLRDDSDGSNCFRANWDSEIERMQLGSAADQAQKAEQRERFSGWIDTDPLGFFDDPNFANERDVVENVVDLGDARGFATVFLYLPAIYVPLRDDEMAARFEEIFGAPLLTPPPEVRAQLNANTYTDRSHPNTQGRAIIQAWLAEALPITIDTEARP